VTPPSEKAASLGERERVARLLGQAELRHPLEACGVERVPEAGERQRLVEA